MSRTVTNFDCIYFMFKLMYCGFVYLAHVCLTEILV